jgi:hypothetical protein
MSRVLIGMVLVMFAVTMGCSCGGGGSAKGVAKSVLEAMKAKDIDKMVSYMDLQGIYDKMPEPAKKQLSFEEFKKQTIEAMKKGAEQDKDKKFDYKNLEVKEDGKTWKKDTIKLTKVGGKWMLGADAMGALGEEEMPEPDGMPVVPDMDDMGDDMPDMPE